jgi:hypothetical protein
MSLMAIMYLIKVRLEAKKQCRYNNRGSENFDAGLLLNIFAKTRNIFRNGIWNQL